MTKVFKTPFGALGDKHEVPIPTQTDGSVSYEQGFGIDYNRDYEDPQAKDIEREKLNQLFYDLTQAVGELQQFGYMLWQAGEYQAGMRVFHNGKAYVATKKVNLAPPASGWSEIPELTAVLLSGNQTIAGTKTFSSFPVTPSSAPTANYQVANKKYVDDSAIGVGQTWQDVTGSREFETTYTNTAGRSIAVSVSVQDNLAKGTTAIRVVVGGEIIHQQEVNSQGIKNILNAFFIVPNGVSYRVVNVRVNGAANNDVLHKWVELR